MATLGCPCGVFPYHGRVRERGKKKKRKKGRRKGRKGRWKRRKRRRRKRQRNVEEEKLVST